MTDWALDRNIKLDLREICYEITGGWKCFWAVSSGRLWYYCVESWDATTKMLVIHIYLSTQHSLTKIITLSPSVTKFRTFSSLHCYINILFQFMLIKEYVLKKIFKNKRYGNICVNDADVALKKSSEKYRNLSFHCQK
jgi:hypothetical protein